MRETVEIPFSVYRGLNPGDQFTADAPEGALDGAARVGTVAFTTLGLGGGERAACSATLDFKD